MSFIATANPPVTGAELQVENHPWFPPVSLPELRRVCLLDGTVTPERLRHALVAALDTVNGELRGWRIQHEAQGYASLAAVPCEALNGTSANVARYLRAVYAHVQADMAEAYRDIDTTPSGEGKAERVREKIEAKIEEHRRTMRWALSDLLAIPRTSVELI